MLVEPGQGEEHVVPLGRQPGQVLRHPDAMLQILGDAHKVVRMPLPGVVGFPGCRQLLEPELAHGLEHLVARFIPGASDLPEQALIDERDDTVEDGHHLLRGARPK